MGPGTLEGLWQELTKKSWIAAMNHMEGQGGIFKSLCQPTSLRLTTRYGGRPVNQISFL